MEGRNFDEDMISRTLDYVYVICYRYAARGRGSFQGNTISADQLANALAAVQSASGAMQGTSSGGMGGMTGFTSQRPPTSSASSGGLRMPSASSFFK